MLQWKIQLTMRLLMMNTIKITSVIAIDKGSWLCRISFISMISTAVVVSKFKKERDLFWDFFFFWGNTTFHVSRSDRVKAVKICGFQMPRQSPGSECQGSEWILTINWNRKRNFCQPFGNDIIRPVYKNSPNWNSFYTIQQIYWL